MNDQHRNDALICEFDAATGVATLTLAMPGRVNVINDSYGLGLRDALEWARGREGLKGIILTSAHKDFCAGADLDKIYRVRDAAELFTAVMDMAKLYRAFETAGVPVVAALNGTALGGGYELALACHRRIAIDDPRIKFGLPEVQLGVLPGGGGTQRLPRLIGIQPAAEAILQGKEFRAAKARSAGLVDELVPDADALRAAALKWIAENPKARQPWDENKPRIPGPRPGSADARNLLMAASAMLRKKTAGVFTAPEAALSAIQEGLSLEFERALEVEARYFVGLVVGDQSKDMMRTLWFFRQAALKHEGLPKLDEGQDAGIRKVAILGAGMMGAGLAYVCADAGYEVVLEDIKQDALDRGVAHFEAELAKRKRHLDDAGREAIRARLTPSTELTALAGADLIIEAVFENLELKRSVTKEAEPQLSEGGIWASNTSAIPIADLAEVSAHADRFIGLHYFSPVEVMPLLEIVRGPKTSDETLARCLDFCRRIKKLPIVVNDGYGFYTTRVFSSYIMEGAQLVAEGHDPVLIEWAARQAGMVVAPLQVFDEVTLTLPLKAAAQSRKYLGDASVDTDGLALVTTMVEHHQRGGRAAGAGFYDYEGGRRVGLWPGLADLVSGPPARTGVDYLARRLLLVQAVQAVHCLEAGILRNARDGEVGAIFGIGFAPNTGGPFGFFDRQDLGAVVRELDELAATCGERYAAPKLLRDMAENNQKFFPDAP
ncbi:Fatty acid oxidation complex subunit alpha [Enhygromyxa salina]|uniref:Fatty acid oxidation complex subunit alpha n=1 Tax=Enhygromyxa salina TaxID=215803 RepID=A0A2S9XJJ8_9BACT|nr:3-hydroxyacyl-CoA dehydrogenase NAD-binding domain-containing protein [Enhygromyxa salina]PRP93022.1 Fatty acid oxidation complex subunit alpha [Enhygromyxa salina]